MGSFKSKSLEKLTIEQLEMIVKFVGLKIILVKGKPFSYCEGMLLPTHCALVTFSAQSAMMDKLRHLKINISFEDGITPGLEGVSLDFGSEEFNQESNTRQKALILVIVDMLTD